MPYKNPEDKQRWYKNNREKMRAADRRYRQRHPERRRASRQRWLECEDNRKKARLCIARWHQNNPRKKVALNARRRARNRGVANTLTQEQIDFETSIARAMWPDEDLHIHHVIPLSKGGGHAWGNIMVLPASLNLSIGDKLPEEAYKQSALAMA